MSPYKSVANVLADQTSYQQQCATVVDNMTKLLASLNRVVQQMDVDMATKMIIEPRDLCVLMNNPYKQFKYALHALMVVLIAEDNKKILNQMNCDQLIALKTLFATAKKCKQIDIDSVTMQTMRTMDIDRRGLMKQVALLWDDIEQMLFVWAKSIDAVYAEKRLKKQKQNSAKKIAAKKMKEIYDGETITMEELRKILGFSSSAGLCIKINAFLNRFPERKNEVNNWFVVKGKNRKAFKVEFLDVCKQALQKRRAYDIMSDNSTINTTKNNITIADIVPTTKLDNKASIVALQKILDKLLNAYQDVCEYPARAKILREQIDEANDLLHKDTRAKNALREARNAWDEAEKVLDDVTKQIEDFVKKYSK